VRILLLQNCEAEGFGLYATALASLGATLRHHRAFCEEPFPGLSGLDGVLVGGTPISAYHVDAHPFLQKEVDFLHRLLATDAPCLGICCGAQLLAQCLGAVVSRNRVMEIGTYSVTLTRDGRSDEILAGFPEVFPVFHWHGDTFGIPQGARLLATGQDCRNQMFRLRNAIGLQFHLEVLPADAARWSAVYAPELTRAGKTDSQVYAEALASEGSFHSLARQLMSNFLRVVTSHRDRSLGGSPDTSRPRR
jgi:GMP synthase (glutamine-hydrolysing)